MSYAATLGLVALVWIPAWWPSRSFRDRKGGDVGAIYRVGLGIPRAYDVSVSRFETMQALTRNERS